MYLEEHQPMCLEDHRLQWLLAQLLQRLSTSRRVHWIKESLWIRLYAWTFCRPHMKPFGVAEKSDLHWPQVVDYSGLHWTWVAGAPGWGVHGQDCIICRGGLSIGGCTILVPLPPHEFGNLEAEGQQWQYWHGCISLPFDPWLFVKSWPDTPGLHAERSVDTNYHLRCQMIWHVLGSCAIC